MKVIAAIQADLEVTPLGTRSRLADELLGVPVLRRTVERISETEHVDAVYVLCSHSQHERCATILRGSRAVVRTCDAPAPPWAALVRVGRKWSLDGWRGGLGGTTVFDEYMDAAVIDGLLRTEKADVVLCVPPAVPLFDPALADRMIEHHRQARDDSRLTFTQAPPGVAGILLEATLVHELAAQHIPIGWVFSYKPDTPQKDLLFQPCCCEIPSELRYAAGRLLADTDRSTARVAQCLQECDRPDAARIGRWLARWEDTTIEPLPREVEIELTTDDAYPDSIVRPRGGHVEARGPIDPANITGIVREITRYDDSLVVLAGFGDPLRHPRFPEILHAIRAAVPNGRPLFGLAVRTSAADLSEAQMDALITHQVDVLNVTLDAWTPELYGRLHSPDDRAAADLGDVLRRLDRLAEMRQQRQSVVPIAVPEMTKLRDNVHELDDFHDGWIRRVGAVLISGPGHSAGQFEDRSVMSMAPLPRVACRRLRARCMVLADGRVTVCDQDFQGRFAVGNMTESSLQGIWRGIAFSDLRDAHGHARFDVNSLCVACDDWHRP